MPLTRLLAFDTLARAMLCFAGAAALALSAAGCTTAAIVTAGTVAGIAAATVSTGADAYRLGKLDSVDQARFDHWIVAVRAAAADLGLKIENESDNGKGEWRCRLVDDRKSEMMVIVEKRTATLCRTRIDVGFFGSEPTARLILARIRYHENPTAATQPWNDLPSPP